MKPESDDYPTCAEVYATLRIYHREAATEVVSSALGLEPTATQTVGDTYVATMTARTKKLNGWFFSTESFVSSFDAAKHLSYLLDRLAGREVEMHRLVEQGWRADICCMWDSAYGHGGPTLDPQLLARLSTLGVELWFDVYFHGAYDLLEKEKTVFGGR